MVTLVSAAKIGAKAGMGAGKQYEREDLLDRAIELFRRQGYTATSTADLVAELGVNRKSMYAEFGSKQGLFEAALERYSRVHLSGVLASIEAPGASIAAIRTAFNGYASAIEGRYRGLGCLMCNTAIERAALDGASGAYVAAYLERLTRAFRRALETGARGGEIEEAADLDDLAAFLTTTLIGLAACIRANAPAAQVYAACRVALSRIGPGRVG